MSLTDPGREPDRAGARLGSASLVWTLNVAVGACDVTAGGCCFVISCLAGKDIAKTSYPLADQFVTSEEALFSGRAALFLSESVCFVRPYSWLT